jgi:3-methyladenine DNA glycosylase/8-oxoguanine DNA glycosylase
LALLAAGACSSTAAKPCPPLDSTAAWARVNQAWSREVGTPWTNDSLRQVLLRLAERDQAARDSFAILLSDSAYARRLARLDSTLALELTHILDRFGLPTRSLVGAAGSDAALLIVQHNASLQQPVLAMARALLASQVSPQALAMLEDRVRTNAGTAQRYGTQFTLGPDGHFRFAPTESLPGLEARRSGAGLPPLPQYVCLLEASGLRVDRRSLPR